MESLLNPDQQQSLLYSSDLELGETTKLIFEAVERMKPARIVLDSLSEIRLLAQSSLRYRRQLLAMKHYFARSGATVLALDDLTTDALDKTTHSIAHGVIRLEELSPGAQAIGAVNTVVVRDGRLIGHNTDTTGFARAITELVRDPAQSIVAVIGAGGVGKAITFALAGLDVAEIRIFDTDRAKATQLAGQIGKRGKTDVAGSVEDAMRGVTGVVNGSPVGMLPNRGTPVPDALLHKGLWVADAVYTPLWTPLLNAAKAEGAEVMTGRELAIYQAADAFELFTGLKPSAVEMGNAFDAVMARRYAKVNAA